MQTSELNYFKEMNVKKPNIYGADDVKVTKVNGKKVWKDLSGELVTGAILGPRYGKDLIFKNFFQVKNGLVNGLRWEFYSTGQPKTLKAMKDGVENGVFMRWDKYGFVNQIYFCFNVVYSLSVSVNTSNTIIFVL